MIVHDLRTPLTSVISGIGTVRYLGPLNPMQEETLDIACNGGETLLGMINDLLNISKMENGALQLDLHEVLPHEIIHNAVEQVRFLATGKHIELCQQLGADLPPVQADDEMLCRILVNLMGNAIKFTPANGRIELCAKHDQEQGELFLLSKTPDGVSLPKRSSISSKSLDR
jgi:signal transduction histidine kinase